MRILILTNLYPPDIEGGYEKACADTVTYLKEQGHEVHILTRYSNDAAQVPEAAQTHNIYRELKCIDYQQPAYTQKWNVERHNYKKTTQCIEQVQPDLIYVWSQRYLSLTVAYAAQDSGIPCVFEMGDIWFDSYFKPGIKAAIKRKIKAWLPGLRQRPLQLKNVISVSHWMAQDIQKRYAPKRMVVIPNGVALPKTQKPQDILPSHKQLKRALFAGRLVPAKGLHLAIEALAINRAKGHAVTLDIAGEGDLEYIAKCKARIEVLQLTPYVNFLGWQDMSQCYQNYEILLMPTCMREPFGLVLIEAMIQGLNVIAPRAYGPAEVIQSRQTGWLFTPGCARGLACQWAYVLQHHKQRQEVSQRAQHYARETFALPIVKKQVLQELQQVVKQAV